MQINGHVTDEEGKKKIVLKGKWDSFLDMQKCNEEGEALPGAELIRLWTVSQPLSARETALFCHPLLSHSCQTNLSGPRRTL